jgi:4-hydroxybenzoate polyprenyltransferase
LLTSVRPEQWTKNLFVFAGILFGQRLLDLDALLSATAAFVIFCGLSGAVYLCNDIADRSADREHPLKRHRPIASGQLRTGIAATTAAVLFLLSIGAAGLISGTLALVAFAYAVLLTLYSLVLKHRVILDVLAIAFGFVLRAAAGAVAVEVPISQWLLICTTLLAIFLALSKRRHELTLLVDGASGHRPILLEYSPYLLDQMIGVVTASTLVAYSFYAISPETADRLGTDRLGITIPFVLYGIFRYLYLVHLKREGGSPSTVLLSDRPLLICVGLWSLCVVLVLYSPLGG